MNQVSQDHEIGPLPSVFQTTALDPVGRQDPHARLDKLRAQCPVLYDAQLGGFFLTRYEDVRLMLTQSNVVRDPRKAVPEAKAIRKLCVPPPAGSVDHGRELCSILLIDDPAHSRIRHPIAKAFNSRVGKCSPRIESVIGDAISALADRNEFDVVANYAEIIPGRVISGIIGVSDDDAGEFRAHAAGAALALHPMRSRADNLRMIDGQNNLTRFLLDLIAERRSAPRDDLVSDIVGDRSLQPEMTDYELAVNLRLLLTAGNLTTTDLISNALWLLLSHAEELARLRGDWSLLPKAIEEVLRFEPPIDATDRVSATDFSIAGHAIAKGAALTASLRGANRDAAVFDRPHSFDIQRKMHPHLAFGGGSHFCLGAPLARLAAQISVGRLLQTFPTLSLAEPDHAPVWKTIPPFRGLARLQVRKAL